jgi:prephenate dehydrogenase
MLRVGIVGYGRFGRALGELVTRHGGSVTAYDPGAPDGIVAPSVAADSIAHLVSRAGVVVVATPVDVMRGVFVAIRDALANRAEPPLVMDVGSVKVAPAAALTSTFGAGARVVATHPLFGPTSLAAAERPMRVVVCPSNAEAVTLEAERFWRDLGCEIVRATAEEHDRAMARSHALAFFFAKGLVDAGLAEPPSFAPPSFQALARSVEAVRSDAGHLFRTIEVENPYAAEMRSRLLAALAAADASLTSESVTEVDASIPPIPSAPADGTPAASLIEERARIDDLDRELVHLLARRAELARRVAHSKEALGLAMRDPVREAAVFASRKAWAEAVGLDANAVLDVYAAILRFSRAHQAREA